MSFIRKTKFLLFLGTFLMAFFVINNTDVAVIWRRQTKRVSVIHAAVVICGNRMDEALIMIKSALLFSSTRLHWHIFADKPLQELLNDKLEEYDMVFKNRFTHQMYDIQLPETEKHEKWKNIYRPCATQRLFLPTLLHNVTRVLYVDTDVLFLAPVETLWKHFGDLNSSQLAAMTWETEPGNAYIGYSTRFTKHPFYPPLGLNSGVMLMDLTKMRRVNWTANIQDYYQQYKSKIRGGDQDIMNIYFYHFPERLHRLECRFNYRTDHCGQGKYKPNCESAATDGVAVIHGNRMVFHTNRHPRRPIFEAVYNVFSLYDIQRPVHGQLLKTLIIQLDALPVTEDKCADVKDLVTRNIKL